ncbi:MAG: 2-oxo acid dehydrogenase subunit E2 [Lachnospiraceae bacterium]|nr:2-oxo acid dehydrogenase subunit E2 [Lachnospiraceae bacterium]
MSEKRKRKWGDRRDGHRVNDATGLNIIMGHIMPNRADAEVFFQDNFDVTELMTFIEKKNAEHPEYKTTIFHAIVFAVAKMVNERPKMNRFIQGRRTYERDEIIMSFMAKRRFADGADEAFMNIIPKEGDTLDSISHKIYGDVREARKSEHSTGGIDAVVDGFAKIPRLLLMLIVRIIRWLDFWGVNPKALTEGDANYSSVLLSNLGSIGCPSVYHHLNNYGTNSFMITVGTVHKEEIVMADGTKQIRDVVDIGATLDERIADGFYFARSLKVIKYLFANPEKLEETFETPSGFEYK